ncbi:zinc-finger homeodomain protein 1-like [Magnolia sinica]|uniref:zinc-finger homeodomain protein 1-like n=1 Tax=Magnolia sinica TaxID=86752 RepID=UPI00265A9E5C|nr:zinc-finger homeodomain protein 1-like [Magnolia sinica]
MESDGLNETYRECLRNHAASLGSYATDGCGEFTSDGLQCAACGCHRNFHRKIILGSGPLGFVPNTSVESHESDRSGKKRNRTKFSAEQKEKMLGFAEKLGWRMQRKEKEEEIEVFCREVGVSRQVFKVWMHNHKNSSSSTASSNTGIASSALTTQ